MKIDLKNYVNLYAETPEMFCIMKGPEHVFEFVNEAHIKALGFNATGMTVRQAQPESLEVFSILDNVYKTGKTAKIKEAPITVGPKLRYFDLTYAAHRNKEDEIDGILALVTEVSDVVEGRRQIETQMNLINSQKNAFELALKESSLTEVLEQIILDVEKKTNGLGSILLLDESGKRLVHGAAPHLPKEYNDIVAGLEVGPNVGSCGTAIYRSESVIVSDIDTDPLWENYRHITQKFGLKACWSTPIVSSRGKVLGTFALYHKEIHSPSNTDLAFAQIATNTASIILERNNEILQRHVAEERLNYALYSSNIGYWDWNAKTGYTFLSDTLMKEWGIDPKTYKNTLEECFALIHEDDVKRVQESIKLATFQGVPYDVDYRVRRPDGEIIWINAKGRYYLDSHNAPERLSGIAINISRRIESENELKEALKIRDEFLSVASHELRTPLTSLKIQGQTLLRKYQKNPNEPFAPESIAKICKNTEEQVNRLVHLIDDMLDVSRIRTGKLSFNPREVDICELIQNVIQRMESQFESNGYAIPAAPNCANASGIWDHFRIEQVMINLLTNAIKYGNKKPIEIKIQNDIESVTIAVRDHGIGIPEESKDRIFHRFERAVSSNEISGLGLGLFISMEIVNSHHGQIWFESHENQGTTFFVKLPKL